MTTLTVEPATEQDIRRAHDWYEGQREGLGEPFLHAAAECIERVQRHPGSHPLVHDRVRRALLQTFPYALLYRYDDDHVAVIACFHGKRNPETWQGRV